MLDALRRNASGWVAKVLIGLLALSFAVWGIADIFTGFGGETVAEVGDEKIDANMFQREMRSEMDQFAQRLGQPLSLEQARQFGLDRMALSRLISLAALDGASRDLGLTVGDEAVGQNILTDPALQGPFGRFDRDLFRQSLQQTGVTEERFIEQRRKFLTRRQFIDVIEAGAVAPQAMVDVVNRFQQETRVVSYIILPPSLVGTVADPDDATVQSFYEAGASAFTLPETRDFSIMVLEAEDITSTVTIAPEDLEAAYEQRRGDYDIPERRDIVQIAFPSAEAAQAADEKLRAGTPVAEIVSGLGLKMADVERGMVTHKQMLSPELADAAFALDEGAFSDPVQGPLGWVIVHARKIEPAKPSTFDQVKDELRKEMELEIARDQVYDIQNNIEDARAGGEPLADIAARNNLTVRSFSGITADGKTRGGDPVELPDLPELLTTVYANQAGEQIPPLNTNGDGYYWIEIDGVTPPELRPLADVRADVVKLWKEKKREAELEEMAIKMSARGNAGESFEKLAGEINRGLLTAPGIQRYTQSDTFSRTAVSRLFAASEGGFTYGPVGLGDSLIVMQVKEIRDPSQDTSSEAYKKTEADVLDSIQADMISSFIVGYQKELGVSVNAPLLQRLTVTDSNR